MYKIYGISDCGFCKRATALLQQQGFAYSYVPLDNSPELLEVLKGEYGWKTVPMVILLDQDQQIFVGGYTDLVERLNNKK